MRLLPKNPAKSKVTVKVTGTFDETFLQAGLVVDPAGVINGSRLAQTINYTFCSISSVGRAFDC